ncbi:family 75 glycoside hydrolase [Leptodontidium sp. MPI-SDFR-AT-0119]|nr:family 75 glycoside hydrolase [Leptodontidium sp. MPI-SDFR-AT-0119]
MHLPFTTTLPLILSLLTQEIQARDVPANIQTLYNNIKKAGSCTKVLKSGFYAKDDPPNTFSYCGDHIGEGVVYLQGTGGALADMDIDCDGLQNSPASDGRCGSSTDTQSHTSFEDTVKSYNKGVDGLDAYIHPYVVFGNVGSNPGFVNYDPRKDGVHELGLIAVVCGNGKMFYGIWGDENGDDGPRAVIGEASIGMATLCFGTVVNGNNGHDETDVLYLAFTGADAVPGKDGAKWNAKNAVEFEESLKGLGDKLVAKIGGGSTTTTTLKTTTTTKSTTSTTTTTTTSTAPTCTSCSWTGHCAGATCSSADDCDGDLVCTGGTCGGCTWVGHCLCATCSTGDDCADDLVCKSGKCANP